MVNYSSLTYKNDYTTIPVASCQARLCSALPILFDGRTMKDIHYYYYHYFLFCHVVYYTTTTFTVHN